ncbi:hypothetical protein [Mangrovicoccus ximenensis]|nr:hypothetical protein [Mangrovicoccus ximenensis]
MPRRVIWSSVASTRITVSAPEAAISTSARLPAALPERSIRSKPGS